ncbi:MAG: hypothetical protein F9K22_01945 [Bacteroidetes bacterium]|nr:MAG: hypothetical protein F9K22_01945 [Bacteroidota bacterium]
MKKMERLLLSIILVIGLGILSCENPTGPEKNYTVTITGTVTRLNNNPLDSVVVVINNPFKSDTTSTDGVFAISFTSTESNTTSGRLTFSRLGFYSDTLTVQYSSTDKEKNVGQIVLRGLTSAQDSVVNNKPSSRPGVISFVSSSASLISIRGAGSKDAANLIFAVKDSLGNPVDALNKTSVSFRIVSRPDSLVELNKNSAVTDAFGLVTVQLTSGQKSGIAQVQAIAAVKRASDTTQTDTIKSPVVSITIAGGNPVPSRFTIGSNKVNVPGLVKFNQKLLITAVVGDTFGNPVQKGTLVYFTTTGGIIQPQGETSEDGTVSISLTTGNPAPSNGIAVITAQVGTAGAPVIGKEGDDRSDSHKIDDKVIVKGIRTQKNKTIQKTINDKKAYRTAINPPVFSRSITVLFSGSPFIVSGDTNFVVPALGSKQLKFTVTDQNGNPLSQGTSIRVTGTGLDTAGAVLSGDIINTMPDTYDQSYTHYSVTVSDKRTKNFSAIVPIGVTIEVTGENGNIKKTIYGVLSSAASDSGKVGTISLVSTATDTVVVNGAGSPNSADVQVKVLNASGQASPNVPISFSIAKSVGGGEYLTSTTATTDANGIATTSLVSGIKAGTVQIVGSVKRDSVSISSGVKNVVIKTGQPASIALVSSSASNLSVKGGGGSEIAVLVFEARDSLGNAIDAANQSTITLSIKGDTAGARINPSSIKTDPNSGRVTTSLAAGVKSGIILVTAQIGSIKSTPVQFSISGGAPVESRFTLTTQKINIPTGSNLSLTNTISAALGDTFGNPVQQGTVVYFTSNGGLIQPAAQTNASGLVSVSMTAGNPQPPGGIATVTAQVGGGGLAVQGKKQNMDISLMPNPLRSAVRSSKNIDSDIQNPALLAAASLITKSVNIVFSGKPQIYSQDSVFTVPGLGSKQIQFIVDDINGNPLASGAQISVTATVAGMDASNILLTGDVNKTIPDTDNKNYTKFTVNVADKRTARLNENIPITLNVAVTGPNGDLTKTLTGTLSSAASDSGKVRSIMLVDSAIDTVVVNGAGFSTSKLIQAKVIDVFNQPIDSALVSFVLTSSLNGGEYLSTVLATTDGSGLASTNFHSGIRSGMAKIVAMTTQNGQTFSSSEKFVYIKTGPISNIQLLSSSATTLSVKGGGGTENSILVFQAQDSLGNAVDGANQATITMTLFGDTAGATVNPAILKTDPNTGRFTINVKAGIQAGLLQVVAQSGSTKSGPVQINISGGLPAQSMFTLSIPKKNVSVVTEKSLVVSVTAGDAYGNPAKIGSIIGFKTTGGIIDASAATTSSGAASAVLQIVNPQPSNGIAVVEAKTFGINNTTVRDTQTVVFSREAIISEIGGPFSNFEIEDGLSKTFQYQINDINGNPVASGNNISVECFGSGSSNVVLTGDVNVVTVDSKIPGVGTTLFSFTARDTLKNEGQGPKSLGFKIKVNGPNTSGMVNHTFEGVLKGGAGVGNEGSVASVVYVRSSKDTIFVANAGAITTDTITFRVRNLNQMPVKGAAVQFYFSQAMNASEYISPSYGISDDSGEVKVVVHSGIKAGVLNLVAKVTAGNSIIMSNAVPIYIKTGPIAQLALISVDHSEISVRGVGGQENSSIVFEGRDILGNPLDFANQSKIYFDFVPPLGMGEDIKPDSAITNPFTGRVSASIHAGTKASVMQIIARNADGTIKSSPVPIVVHGGFAVDSLFVFMNAPKNISMFDRTPTSITMQLGDRYGNPVKPGTAVYFNTNAGIIGASAFTDKLGVVQTTFTAINEASFMGNRKITATTVGDSAGHVNTSITSELGVLMSGAPYINTTSIAATDTITLFDGASSSISFSIKDAKGNPISSGHIYSISLEGNVASQLALGGDIAGTMPDNNDPLVGTNFSFSIADRLQNAGSGGEFKIRITVEGKTGTTMKIINGKLLAPANIVVPPTARVAASIALISTSATDISIAGVGGMENATMTYEVRDSVGAPVTLDNKAIVRFNTIFYPNTFTLGGTSPSILPTLDSTDENGRVRVSIMSGSQAGAVQIEAIINLTNPVRVIKSQPVRISINSGFADQNHFTIAPSRYNFPGLEKAFYSMPISIQAGDKYSNPVKEGTTVYFNSANGIIQTLSGMTDKNGFVTMNLYSSNPYPLAPNLASGLANGFSRVYARTIGRDSTFIADSVEILWTGKPVLTKTGGPATYTIAQGGSDGPFTFTVADYLSHPMSEGTSISVSGTGLVVSGNANVVMPDTKSSGPGLTTFTISIADADPTDTNPPVESRLILTVTHPVYGTYTLELAAGTVD